MPEFVTSPGSLALVAIGAYLLGSIPFGMIVAHLMGLGNLRDIGSGNIGATNVLRTGNKLAAALTLVFDAGKGAVAVLVARQIFGEDAAQLAGFAAFFGHLFPVWLGFKGGKGVATFLGILLAIYWPLGIACCLVWLAGAAWTRYSSGAALMAAVFAPIIAFLLAYSQVVLLAVVLAILIVIRHWANIGRLRAGTEPQIGRNKS